MTSEPHSIPESLPPEEIQSKYLVGHYYGYNNNCNSSIGIPAVNSIFRVDDHKCRFFYDGDHTVTGKEWQIELSVILYNGKPVDWKFSHSYRSITQYWTDAYIPLTAEEATEIILRS